MNRWLMVVVMGLTVMGCAAGVEDPQPAPEPEPVAKDPPAKTFSGELENPYDKITTVNDNNAVTNLPPRNRIPQPGPGEF